MSDILSSLKNCITSGLHVYLPNEAPQPIVFYGRQYGGDTMVNVQNRDIPLRNIVAFLQHAVKPLTEYNSIVAEGLRIPYMLRDGVLKAIGTQTDDRSKQAVSELVVSCDSIQEAITQSDAEAPTSVTAADIDGHARKRRRVDGLRRVPIVSRFEVLQPPGGLELFLQSLRPMLDQSSEKLGWTTRKAKETKDIIIYSTRSENVTTVDPYAADARHLGVTTPAHSMAGVLRPMMQMRRQHKTYKPIIIVSQASSSLLSIWNAKRFLEDGEFITTQEAKQAAEDPTKPPSSVDVSCVKWIKGEELDRMQIKHRGLFKVIDNPERLKPSEWDMVCCAFVTSSTWQFRGWFSTNPVEIFDRCRGYHLSYTEEPPKGDVTSWKVRLLNIPKDRRLSHLYKGVVREFWLDLFKTTIRTRQNMQEA